DRVTGRGIVGLDGALDLTAVLLAGPELTADVVATAKDARWVENDQGLLEVRIHLGGKLPRIRPEPDPDFVANLVARILMSGGKRPDKKQKDRGGGSVEDALRGLQRVFPRRGARARQPVSGGPTLGTRCTAPVTIRATRPS